MASQAIKKSSVSNHPETHEADECCENITPPGVGATAGANVPVVDVVDCSSAQPSRGTKPLNDNCNFATPSRYSRNCGANAKTRASNLQSTLTPLLKYINLGAKCRNPQECNLDMSTLYRETTVGCYQVIESLIPGTGSFNGPPACLQDEICPDVTLDLTVDSTMSVASPPVVSRQILPETPVSLREMVNKLEQVDDTNSDFEMGSSVTLSEISSVLTPEGKNVTNESNGLRASLEVTQDISSVDGLKNNGPQLELSGQNVVEIAGSVTSQTPASRLPGNVTLDISSSSEKSAQHTGKNMMNDSNGLRASLETTRDISTVGSLKNNGPPLELRGQNMVEIAGSVTSQTPASMLPGNVTLDISSSSEKSAQHTGKNMMNDSNGLRASLETTRDISTVGSLKNNGPPLELRGQNVVEMAGSVTSQTSASMLPGNVTLDISSSSEKSAQHIGKNMMNDSNGLRASLETTRDISTVGSLKNNGPPLELSGQNVVEIARSVTSQTPASMLPGNVTLDISSSSEKSAQHVGKNMMNDSNGLRASLETTRDISTVGSLKNNGPPLELRGQNMVEIAGSVTSQTPASMLPGNVTLDISSSSEKSAQHIGKNMMNDSNGLRASLETTRDISTVGSLENNGPPLELKGQNTAEIIESITFQSSVDDSSSTLHGNVTHNLSSSGDKSAQCIVSQSTTCDVECTSSSKNCTLELQVEPMERSYSGQLDNTKVLTNHEDAITNKVSQPSLIAADSMSSTFTTLQPSESSTSADLNTAVPISCPQNNTLILPPSNVSKPTAKSEAEDQTRPMCDNNSAAEMSGSRLLQNNTLDTKSLSVPSGTFVLPERSSNISPHNTTNRPSPPKLSNPTTDPTDNTFEGRPPVQSNRDGITAGTEVNGETVDLRDGTFDPHPVTGAKAKEHSQSSLHTTGDIFDLNLDDSLDLMSNALITSTPMPDSKTFKLITAARGTEKISQKRLYGDGHGETLIQVATSSNTANERTAPSVKSLLPPRAASRLLQYKPVSSIPASCKLPTSGLPMTKLGAQAVALRNTAAPGAVSRETTGISSSCSGRAAVTDATTADPVRGARGLKIPATSQRVLPATSQSHGSKLPGAGLRTPQPSGIPSATRRAAPSLRPPATNGNVRPTAVSSQTPSQTKQHLVTRTERVPLTKKRKLDAITDDSVRGARGLKIPATSQRVLAATSQSHEASVASTTTDDPVRGARGLKIPATSQRVLPGRSQSHGCADCASHKQQMEKAKEELERVKKDCAIYKQQLEKAKEELLVTRNQLLNEKR